jgi:3,4-dihydroxy-2-butanone 4-phosphate synthase
MADRPSKTETGVSAVERLLTKRITQPKSAERDKVKLVPPGSYPAKGFTMIGRTIRG